MAPISEHVAPKRIDAATARTIAVMSASVLVIGIAYGVAGHSIGLQWWHLAVIAALVLAGSSEFVFVGVLAAGGAPVLGAAAGLLINTRNLGYGLSIGPLIGRGPAAIAGAHLINDETVALTTAQTEPDRARRTFYACGIWLALCWPLGAALGALLGSVVADPNELGLDAAMPALLVALAIPALRNRSNATSALIGVVAAVLSTPFVPAGLPILIALVGLLGALPRRAWSSRRAAQ